MHSDRLSVTGLRYLTRRHLLQVAAWAGLAGGARAGGSPVQVGLDAEFGLADSTSAQAIELGLRVAIAEVNAAFKTRFRDTPMLIYSGSAPPPGGEQGLRDALKRAFALARRLL